jgi:hypothetical protein
MLRGYLEYGLACARPWVSSPAPTATTKTQQNKPTVKQISSRKEQAAVKTDLRFFPTSLFESGFPPVSI